MLSKRNANPHLGGIVHPPDEGSVKTNMVHTSRRLLDLAQPISSPQDLPSATASGSATRVPLQVLQPGQPDCARHSTMHDCHSVVSVKDGRVGQHFDQWADIEGHLRALNKVEAPPL